MQASSFRRRVYELVDVPTDTAGRHHYDWFDVGIATLIVLNVIAVMLETVEPLASRFGGAFAAFEILSVSIFAVEYALRLWSCTADAKYAAPLWGRLRFAARPLTVIDLLAILPAVLPWTGADLRFLRVLRLARMLRVLKLGRYSDAAKVLTTVLRSRRADLGVMLLAMAIVLVVGSGLMYYAEHDAQPDRFSSIPAAMWWAVITLTTIGYGDIYPVTPVGKALGGVIAVFGVGIVALPTAVIAAGFAEALRRQRQRRRRKRVRRIARCPHCERGLRVDGEGRLHRIADDAATPDVPA